MKVHRLIKPTKVSRYLTRFYEAYNTLYFNGKLPKLKVYYGRLKRDVYGETAFNAKNHRAAFITVNQKLHRQGWSCTEHVTLLHEMVHVSIGPTKDSHGKEFQKQKRRLIVAGAFDDIL